MSGKKHGSTHHIVPSSRGGPNEDWNFYRWDSKIHASWHRLFDNRMPSEAIEIVKRWIDKKGNLIKESPYFRRKWRDLFGDMLPQEVIKFIEKEFMGAERLFIKKSSRDKR